MQAVEALGPVQRENPTESSTDCTVKKMYLQKNPQILPTSKRLDYLLDCQPTKWCKKGSNTAMEAKDQR